MSSFLIFSGLCRKLAYGVYSLIFEASPARKSIIVMAAVAAYIAACIAPFCLAPILMVWQVFLVFNYVLLRPFLYIAIGRDPLLIVPDFFQFLINSLRGIFFAPLFSLSVVKFCVFFLNFVFLQPIRQISIALLTLHRSNQNGSFDNFLILLIASSLLFNIGLIGALLSVEAIFCFLCALSVSSNLFIFAYQPETFWANMKLLAKSGNSNQLKLLKIFQITIGVLAINIPSMLFMSFIDKKHLTESEFVCIDNLLKPLALFLENALCVIAELGYYNSEFRNTTYNIVECYLDCLNISAPDKRNYLELLINLMDNRHEDFESPGFWFIAQVCFSNSLSDNQSQFVRQLFGTFIAGAAQQPSEPPVESIDRDIVELPEYNAAFIQNNQIVLSQPLQHNRPEPENKSYCCIS